MTTKNVENPEPQEANEVQGFPAGVVSVPSGGSYGVKKFSKQEIEATIRGSWLLSPPRSAIWGVPWVGLYSLNFAIFCILFKLIIYSRIPTLLEF